jgi:hypothetical protein
MPNAKVSMSQVLRCFAVTAIITISAVACGGDDPREPSVAKGPGVSAEAAPATSTVPDDVEMCRTIVQGLGDAGELNPSVRPVDRVATGDVAPLPLPGRNSHSIREVQTFTQAAELIGPSTVAPDRQLAALVDSGFLGGVRTSFEFKLDAYSAMALEFPTPEDARAFQDVYLDSVCAVAVAMTPIDEIDSGVAFTIEGTDTPIAAFVSGGSLVILSICNCVTNESPGAVVETWARSIQGDWAPPGSA